MVYCYLSILYGLHFSEAAVKKLLFFITILTQLIFLGVSYSQDIDQGLKDQITVAMKKAEKALIKDSRESYNRVVNSDFPIQTDLYTLSHLLMCEDKFFNRAPSALCDKIVKYFEKDKDNPYAAWRIEGCVFPKVVIGLHKYSEEKILDKLISTQCEWGRKHFRNKVFGECFSVYVDRVYGSTNKIVPADKEFACVHSDENNAKYFYGLIKMKYKFYPWNAILIMPSKEKLNKHYPRTVHYPYTWRAIIDDIWILYVKKLTSNKLQVMPSELNIVSDKLEEAIKKKISSMYLKILSSDTDALSNGEYAELMNGHFLAALIILGYGKDPELVPHIKRLLYIQKADGHWGNEKYGKNGIALNGGNTWTSATFWAHWGLYCYLNQDELKPL